ncbi:hypothetical protein PAEPH01_2027 [Pancytospora epiphaga]|nr:hypothetical protein PAEPH01_2027 [Pancytospora epiphaga]
MDVADLILQEVNNKDVQAYEVIRSQLKSKKALSKEHFNVLISLLEKDPMAVLEFPNPTHREVMVMSKAISRVKFGDATNVFTYLANEDSKRAPVLIHALLVKRYKIDNSIVAEYLQRLIKTKKVFLCHFQILLAVSRGYPRAITSEVLEFCKRHPHGITEDILKKHCLDIE